MTKIKVAHILHCVGGVDVYLRLILENTNPELIENIVIHGINDTSRQFYDQNNKDVIHYKTSIFRKISMVTSMITIAFKTITSIQSTKLQLLFENNVKIIEFLK